MNENMKNFYKGKRVLITGNTGFKGSWLSLALMELGAKIEGYSLEPEMPYNLFNILKLDSRMITHYSDIRDYDSLNKCFCIFKPEIVFHLAAQPLVRESYANPRYTYECNVMGTVNVLEAARCCDSIESLVNVTTDKVYENREWIWGYRENDRLNGFDPYSNSKSCSELVTQTYIRSFPYKKRPMSTARAGNVIGGGDFSADRIIPDCVRAAEKNEAIIVRNPNSLRPYQHVMDPIYAYLLIAYKQVENNKYAGSYNVGPNENGIISTGELVEMFCDYWGNLQDWRGGNDTGPHEANLLKLDCSLINSKLHWSPKWSIEKSVEKTVEWYKNYKSDDIEDITLSQIREFI